MIPLVTSIPPSIKRQASDGREIGEDYALACVRSWCKQGFAAVSVNAQTEPVSVLVSRESIAQIKVQRDARAEFGRPLIYLQDLMAAARSLTDGPVAITNADIVLDMPTEVRTMIANLEPGQILFSRRCDVREMNDRRGTEYAFGYDFFAFHTRDLATFVNDDFVIGLPWWDHYLLLHLTLRGLRSLPVGRPFAFHLEHTERWEVDNWATLGNRFLDSVRREVNGVHPRGTPAFDYGRRLAQAVLGHDGRLLSRLKARLGRPKPGSVNDREFQMLDRVAALNVAWLDEQRAAR